MDPPTKSGRSRFVPDQLEQNVLKSPLNQREIGLMWIVMDRLVAEGTGPGSDVLLWMPLGLQGNSDRLDM